MAPLSLPGLGGEAAWSIAMPPKGYEDDAPQVVVVGATVVVVTPTGPASGGYEYGVPRRATRPQRAELRDAATGVVRASFAVFGAVSAETWRGRPAIVVRGRRVIPAEGLTREKRDWRVDAYDEQGARIGGVDLPPNEDSAGGVAVVDGWVVTGVHDRGRRAVRISAAGGGDTGVVLPCALGNCDPTSAYSESPFVLGDTVFLPDQSGPEIDAPGRVTAYDVATGARRWSTDGVIGPAGSDPNAYPHGMRPAVVGRVGEQVVVAWRTSPRGTEVVLGLHDRLTGALIATGPRVPDGVSEFRTDVGGTLAVVCGDRCAMWEPATGLTLWQQSRDELSFVPRTVVGGVVYGVRKDGGAMGATTPLALDARSKRVLSPMPPDVTITAIGDRWALVATERVVLVYPVRTL
ncbi:outer membrane protein assembly factor BamB family protein [Embleya sp. MST-111070]|uniref:outer membrane protein assembly factor BamB family protein n=1 Tax=Embleya sp. MST-111070 TaxID=3398231 RepID=UPI003F733C57